MTNSAQSLEQHFDVAFTAPNGIKKLRELILTLAMQGKLVPQDSNDAPASELLKDIANEKERLISEGKIKKQKPLPAIRDDAKPYDLPQGWEWVRLGEVGHTNIGLTYSPNDISDTGIPVLRSNNIQNGLLDLSDLKRVAMSVKDTVLVQEGDLLICARNGSKALVGKTAVISGLTEPMAFGAFMAIFRSQINPFVLKFISSPLFRKMLDEVNTVTINQITQDNLRTTIFPLPPLAEQHRIVAKIDQLMARCDALEALQQAKEAQRLSVHQAAIRQLLDAEHTHTAWQFLQTHFAELYSVKANVSELRKAILQLAVMGKLVPQDPNDIPASELLKEIASEKARLISEGKTKKQKPFPAISDNEKPYDLPQGWEWVRLGDAMLKITDGTHHSPPNTDNGEFLYISAKNIKEEGVLLTNATFVTKEVHEAIYARCNPELGDILYIKDGATTGIVTINNLSEPFSMLSSVALLKPHKNTSNKFILYVLKSPFFYKEMRSEMTGVAITRVTLNKLNEALFPLPPLAEQQRIVAKIDQLMSLCDNLEQQIDASQAKQSQLLAAVMSGV